MRPSRREFIGALSSVAAMLGLPRRVLGSAEEAEAAVDRYGHIPVGVLMRAPVGTPCPRGWLRCNGRAVSRRRWPQLAQILEHGLRHIDPDFEFKGRLFHLPNLRNAEFYDSGAGVPAQEYHRFFVHAEGPLPVETDSFWGWRTAEPLPAGMCEGSSFEVARGLSEIGRGPDTGKSSLRRMLERAEQGEPI